MAVDRERALSWRAPDGRPVVRVIDAHTGGEPFRLVLDGVPEVPGDTMLAKRRWAREHLEGLRRALMWEPRGHADMYGGILTEPVHPESDLGVLFVHNDGFSTMCGHGIVALVTVAVETGLVEYAGEAPRLAIDTPAGRIAARAELDGGRVARVAFENVPSFAAALDRTVETRHHGSVRYDLAYGGAFYAYVDAASLGLALEPAGVAAAIAAGRDVKAAVRAAGPIEHPDAPELGFLYGVVFTAAPADPEHHGRHLCVFADGEVDRSPTGTGVSGRLALLARRGELSPGETIAVESLTGSVFEGRILSETTVGPHPAVVPEISGQAWITGRNELILDPSDPLGNGFLIR